VAAALTVVYVAWGSTFVAMRVAVHSLPPLTRERITIRTAAGMVLRIPTLSNVRSLIESDAGCQRT
jgi:hypothetical protein